ncbi:hypothetical protein UFOVP361_94 [uncultured Caudovirales phage]|uniref:Uncharacterized protein n=1 Tax=uncultured Caudovirales phage TaxID=2100421 RepID=A0A6J7X1V4_9CAUD|nr:hypothetical protein UFOVP361_94 [uncultured Caudovirales phage]
MAVNETRSLNHDLSLGLTDGVFKNLTPDRGGVVEPLDPAQRASVLQEQYNVSPRNPAADDPTPYSNRRRTVSGISNH